MMATNGKWFRLFSWFAAFSFALSFRLSNSTSHRILHPDVSSLDLGSSNSSDLFHRVSLGHYTSNVENVPPLGGSLSALQDAPSDSNHGSEKENRLTNHVASKHPLLFDWTASCGECNPELCDPTPSDCPSGFIRDACDCCYVCGNLEDTPCDLPSAQPRYGQCGEGLVCEATENQKRSEEAEQGYCACALATVVCGNDSRTYSNPCQFRRATARKRNLSKRHDGPCLAAPLVEIPPMNQSAEQGSSAVFSCTVSGFPFAWFEWLKDGESVFQPGSSKGITVKIRSGPLKYQITTWLEIQRTHPMQAGLYTCVAKNQLGEANATAQLEVIEDEFDVANYYVFRGKHYQFAEEDSLRADSNEQNSTIDWSTGLQLSATAGSLDDEEELESESANTLVSLNRNETTGTLEPGSNDERNNTYSDDTVDEELVKTLKELVKPKEFRDIFFDDDDLEEGSGIE